MFDGSLVLYVCIETTYTIIHDNHLIVQVNIPVRGKPIKEYNVWSKI